MPKRSHRHLTLSQRCQIQHLRSSGKSQNAIALELGVHRSTISRETARNSSSCGYHFEEANEISKSRKSAASKIPKKMKGELKELVIQCTREDLSPDQTSGRLKLKGKNISHVSIYKLIWDDRASGGLLYKHLRHGGKKYRSQKSRQAGVNCIPDRVDISERPRIVDEKSRIGDWERDLIISHGSFCGLLTIADRKSKFLKIKKIGEKNMKNTDRATCKLLKNLTKFTITNDNGKEFAAHKKTSKKLGVEIYFARPYKSCDRGLNEHTNGLIRQYLPKKFDFAKVSHKKIQEIEDKLNHRPRKVLQYRTPFEVFFGYEAFATEASAGVTFQT